MNKKTAILIALTAIVLIVGIGYFFLNQYYFKTFNIPSSGNAPTMPAGSIVCASSLLSVNKNDFIVFKNKGLLFMNEVQDEQLFVFRLIATEGDRLLIKDGVVYVNDVNIDENLTLNHGYYLSGNLNENDIKELDSDIYQISTTPTKYIAHLTDKKRDNLGSKISIKKIKKEKNIPDTSTQDKYNKPWNSHWFGPLVIPKGNVFVMGDNRDNAMDSRVIGLIDEDKIVATVIR